MRYTDPEMKQPEEYEVGVIINATVTVSVHDEDDIENQISEQLSDAMKDLNNKHFGNMENFELEDYFT